jgi:hypothetical protein
MAKLSNSDALLVGACLAAVAAAVYCTPLLSSLWATVHANPILQAVFVPSAVGAVLYLLNSIMVQLYAKIRGRFYTSVTLANKDENWTVVLDFIAKQGVVESSAYTATTAKPKKKTWKDWRREFTLGVRDVPKMEYRCEGRVAG